MPEIRPKEEAKGIHSGEIELVHSCNYTGHCIHSNFTTGALIPVRNPNYGGRVRYGYNCPICSGFVPATFSVEAEKKLDEIYNDD